MPTHVAFIRGINVGGHALVSMEALRARLSESGVVAVRTLLQTGNVFFEATADELEIVKATIRQVLVAEFQVEADIMIRSGEEIREVVASNPFSAREPEFAKLFVFFLSDVPSPELACGLPPSGDADVEFFLVGQELYAYCKNGIGRAKLPNFARLLSVTATARNWNTILRVHSMVQD